MPTRLAPLLLLFALAAPVRAVPVTVNALGDIIILAPGPGGSGGSGLPGFALGERVAIRLVYDLDPSDPIWGERPAISAEMHTGGGYADLFTAPVATSAVEGTGQVHLRLSDDLRDYDFQMAGGIAVLRFRAFAGSASTSFAAELGRTESFLPVTYHAPEPAGWMMALVGAALASAWRLGT